MKVLIITGGTSSERKVSLNSAKNVQQGLLNNGYFVKIYDLKNGYPKLKKIAKEFDVIFPVLHGEEGEGGKLHQYLLKLGRCFVGGDPRGFKKGWYKISFKKYCDSNKIITAKWKVIKNAQDIKKFNFPCVLKSSNGGSSREVVILQTAQDLKKAACLKLLKSKDKLFVERYLKGIEITVGILDHQALPVIEIIPPPYSWFNYQNKYSGVTQEIPFAPSLAPQIQKNARKIALKIHQDLNLGHYSRIDFIVSGNIPYVLEVNTIPGLTATSLLPKAAQAIGISFNQLVKKLVDLACFKP